jgi:hypothetical protein
MWQRPYETHESRQTWLNRQEVGRQQHLRDQEAVDNA